MNLMIGWLVIVLALSIIELLSFGGLQRKETR